MIAAVVVGTPKSMPTPNAILSLILELSPTSVPRLTALPSTTWIVEVVPTVT